LLLLQAMLTVCLHQLVLHAERKLWASTQVTPNPAHDSGMHQKGGVFSPIATCAPAGSSSSSSSDNKKSNAELAEGYLLQHADKLQAKQPAAPSRAAVAAWRAVCKRQWADLSLLLLLQDAAAVLASIQPSAAAASSSGNNSSAFSAAAAAVWAMQECRTWAGRFGLFGQSSSADTPTATSSSDSKRSGMAGNSVSSGYASSTAGSTSNTTRRCDSWGPAHNLPAALGLEPILSIDSCTHKATALSAVCLHLAVATEIAPVNSSRCALACTLLATAAAAVSLQGEAALPLVSAVLAAAKALLKDRPAAQHPADPVSGEQQRQPPSTGTACSDEAGSDAQLQVQAATAPGPVAVPGCSPDGWLMCLSIAADVTTAILPLAACIEGRPDAHSTAGSAASVQCVQLLLVLIARLDAVASCICGISSCAAGAAPDCCLRTAAC
jgi:hypothetical protein